MKKKGLIIATIVMVLVLAVSLTTATYAWFSAAGSAEVTSIQFQVAQSADLIIGVNVNNTYDNTKSPTNFYSDSTTYNTTTGKWTGTTNGLGLSVDTGLDLSSASTAVYSASAMVAGSSVTPTSYEKGSGQTVTTGIDMSATIFKANGDGNTITESSVAAAVANGDTIDPSSPVSGDYLNVAFAVAAAKSDVRSYGLLVYVDRTDTLSAVGILAGLHVAYKIDGGSWVEKDIYGATAYNQMPVAPTLPTETIGANTYTYNAGITPASGDAYVWIPLDAADDLSSFVDYGANNMKQIQLVIYLCGPDSDTITSAKGNQANILIKFLAINSSQAAD